MKKCIDCGISKDSSEFYRSHGSYYKYCKSCYKTRNLRKQPKKIKVLWKQCTKCKQTLEASKFCKNSSRADRLNGVCRICASTISKAKAESIKGKHYNNMASVKNSYSISEDQLQDMLLVQQGCCKICGIDFGVVVSTRNRPYSIDHCHITGKVRGLLCNKCNLLLGKIEANLSIIPQCIEYLGAGY